MVEVFKLIFALSTLVSDGVSSDVFRMVGDFVQMNIQGPPPQLNTLSWVFNRTDNVLEYSKTFNGIIHNPAYKDRVDFNKETYSLTLKNLQKTDSGLYEARASGIKVTVLKAYSLSVFDPVEAPVITHLQNCDINSNITLICRGHDLSINFSCTKETCEEKKETSPGDIILSLFVNDRFIICNHSNLVSWKVAKMQMETFVQLCPPEDETSPSAVCLLKTGLYSITLLLMLSAIITVHIREKLIKPS